MRHFLSVAGLIFLAEMADKTQLAVLGLSSEGDQPWIVFLAASVGLILSTGLAVIGGELLNQWIPETYINYLVGSLFVAIGGWYILFP